MTGYILALGVFLLFAAWPQLHLPALWDEATVYLRSVEVYDNFTGYLRSAPSIRDRPWTMHFPYVLLAKAFGPQLWILRGVGLVCVLAGIIFFGRVTSTTSRPLAVIGLTLFFTTPLPLAYLGRVVSSYQVFFLYAFCLWLMERNKPLWTVALVAFLVGAFRESGLALSLAIPAHLWLRGERRWSVLGLLALAAPLGVSLNLFRNLLHTGTPLHHYAFRSGDIQIWVGPIKRLQGLYRGLIIPYRLLPLLFAAFVSQCWFRPRIPLKPWLGFSYALILSYLLVFSGHRYIIPRYYLEMVPFLVTVLLLPLLPVLEKPRLAASLLSGLLLLGFVIGDPGLADDSVLHRYSGLQDTSAWPELQQIHTEAMRLTKQCTAPGGVILTGWPFFEMLQAKNLGYGPPGNYRVERDITGVPDTILWHNYPEQISPEKLQHWLAARAYTVVSFNRGPYHAKVYCRRD